MTVPGSGAAPLPPELLESAAMVEACASHDIGAIFRLAKRHAGIYHSRMARLCQMTPSRVAEYANGKARVKQQHVIERVADGLRIPGHMFGLAPRWWEAEPAAALVSPRQPATLDASIAQLTPPEADSVTHAAHRAAAPGTTVGRVIELSLDVDIDIAANGDASVRCLHTLLNMSPTPLSRIPRELWFEQVSGPLVVEPVRREGPHRIAIRRLHDARALIKFGCQISPPVPTGSTVEIEYVCRGGRFGERLYWRQELVRPTTRVTVRVNQQTDRRLDSCYAVEERPDGSEQTSTDGILWDDDGPLAITLTREHLNANQAVTLTWHLSE